MPTTANNYMAILAAEATKWRRHLHQNPEIDYKEFDTARFIENKLRSFGIEQIKTGIASTGIVASIDGAGQVDGKLNSIGLRADIDALPIEEMATAEERPHVSTRPGFMHACGHDGHTAIMLAVAKYLHDTRDNWKGRVNLIFQPAEEGGAGARSMILENVLEDFPCDEIYAIHNMPGQKFGSFATRNGPLMASNDAWDITINGKGGHAAMPNLSRDSLMIGSLLVQTLQTITSRNADPVDNGVVTVTRFKAGDSYNVIPQIANLSGTCRSFSEKTRQLQHSRIQEICDGLAATFSTEIKYERYEGYPVTDNHPQQAEHACQVAENLYGSELVDRDAPMMMGSEDFSYFIKKVPGCMVFVGAGESQPLHHPQFDFNDDLIPLTVDFFVGIVNSRLGGQTKG